MLVYSAYVAEVYRAGIESVHPSQEAAARSLGLTHGQALRFVVLPQAVRRVIPPLLNDFIGLQKDTALVGALGVVEAFRQAQIDQSATFNYTPYLVAAMLFVADHDPARALHRLARRARPQAAAGGEGRVSAARPAPGEPAPRPALRIEGVHKSFGELEVLRGIDLEVGEHEVVCLIGASGSGKSTLLRCVNLLEPIDAGPDPRRRRRRSPRRGVDARRVRRRIGIVFQSFNLFPHMTRARATSRSRRARCSGRRAPRPRRGRWSCSTASASPTSRTSTPTGSPAASSSASRSSAPSRCSRSCCCSTR